MGSIANSPSQLVLINSLHAQRDTLILFVLAILAPAMDADRSDQYPPFTYKSLSFHACELRQDGSIVQDFSNALNVSTKSLR